MKTHVHIAIALLAIAVGCTKSSLVDVPESQNIPITFEPYSGKAPVTKAAEVNNNTIRKAINNGGGFHVTGFLHTETTSGEGDAAIVENTTDYTKTYMSSDVYDSTAGEGGTASWVTDVTSYWPASGSLDFVAYGLNTDKTLDDGTEMMNFNGSNTSFIFKVPDSVAEQEDLVVSDFMSKKTLPDSGNADGVDQNGTVTFTLKHLLSRVGFKVQTLYTTDSAPDVTIKITDITLHGGFVNEGTVDLLAASVAITPDETKTTASFSFFEEGEYFEAAASKDPVQIYATGTTAVLPEGQTFSPKTNDCYMMLMPGTVKDNATSIETIGTDPYVEITYELSGAGSQTKRLALPDVKVSNEVTTNWTFVANKAYEFLFTVSVESIDFSAEVLDWDYYQGDGNIYM